MIDIAWDTGKIQTYDIIPESSLAANNACYVSFNFLITPEMMVDLKCNKFYWKRTA